MEFDIQRTAWYAGMSKGIPSSHSQRLIIPDDILIQFDILMMSALMLEEGTPS